MLVVPNAEQSNVLANGAGRLSGNIGLSSSRQLDSNPWPRANCRTDLRAASPASVEAENLQQRLADGQRNARPKLIPGGCDERARVFVVGQRHDVGTAAEIDLGLGAGHTGCDGIACDL
jgi:hypothetical protein